MEWRFMVRGREEEKYSFEELSRQMSQTGTKWSAGEESGDVRR